MAVVLHQFQIPVWVAHGHRGPVIALVAPNAPHPTHSGHLLLRVVPGTTSLTLAPSDPAPMKVHHHFVFAHNQAGEAIAAALLIPSASFDVFHAISWSLVEGTVTIPAEAVVKPHVKAHVEPHTKAHVAAIPGAWKLSRGTLTVPANAAPPPSDQAVQVQTPIVLAQDSKGQAIGAAFPLTSFDPQTVSSWSLTLGHLAISS